MTTPLPNIKLSADGSLVTADAKRPAPEFGAMLHRLAHPCPYGNSTDPKYRAAVDRIAAAFGKSL